MTILTNVLRLWYVIQEGVIMMDSFEFNFKNKRIQMWLKTVLPAIILAIFLYTFIPTKLNYIPTLVLVTAVIIYYGWAFNDKKKQKKDNALLN